jgi:hypothetical protein
MVPLQSERESGCTGIEPGPSGRLAALDRADSQVHSRCISEWRAFRRVRFLVRAGFRQEPSQVVLQGHVRLAGLNMDVVVNSGWNGHAEPVVVLRKNLALGFPAADRTSIVGV